MEDELDNAKEDVYQEKVLSISASWEELCERSKFYEQSKDHQAITLFSVEKSDDKHDVGVPCENEVIPECICQVYSTLTKRIS